MQNKAFGVLWSAPKLFYDAWTWTVIVTLSPWNLPCAKYTKISQSDVKVGLELCLTVSTWHISLLLAFVWGLKFKVKWNLGSSENPMLTLCKQRVRCNRTFARSSSRRPVPCSNWLRHLSHRFLPWCTPTKCRQNVIHFLTPFILKLIKFNFMEAT